MYFIYAQIALVAWRMYSIFFERWIQFLFAHNPRYIYEHKSWLYVYLARTYFFLVVNTSKRHLLDTVRSLVSDAILAVYSAPSKRPKTHYGRVEVWKLDVRPKICTLSLCIHTNTADRRRCVCYRPLIVVLTALHGKKDRDGQRKSEVNNNIIINWKAKRKKMLRGYRGLENKFNRKLLMRFVWKKKKLCTRSLWYWVLLLAFRYLLTVGKNSIFLFSFLSRLVTVVSAAVV